MRAADNDLDPEVRRKADEDDDNILATLKEAMEESSGWAVVMYNTRKFELFRIGSVMDLHQMQTASRQRTWS